MKIISKYKDYYDYLSGVWGEDPKLVLDRRDFDRNIFRFEGDDIDFITLYICGYRVEGVYKKDKFYYGDKIREIADFVYNPKDHKFLYPKREYTDVVNFVFKDGKYRVRYALGEVVEDKDNVNEKENCPILLKSMLGHISVEKFPILKDLDIASFLPAEKIYRWLNDWLSNIESKKEQERFGTLTDKNKILNKGFDYKTSFRPKIKKR